MSCYSFGPFSLDPETRVLLRDGEPIAMAGKTLDTLLLLVQNRGRLVDKDELLSRLWPDTVVEEANISQSIFTVRRILGDSPKNHRYIATVAGRGYQFVAPVTESTTRTEPAGSELKEPPRKRSTFWRNRGFQFGAAAITIVVLAVGIALWRAQHPDHGKMPGALRLSRFTSLPGVETMPAFSPDGREVAYVHSKHDPLALNFLGRQVSQANIYVKLIEAGTELRITNHSGADYHPAWSPNGEFIAFYRDEPGTSGYYVVSALGGSERRITDEQAASAGIAWFPGGRHLAISQVSEGSHASPLFEISVETGRRRQMTFPLTGTLGDAWPAFSPDGRTLAFTRIKQAGAFDLCFMRVPEQGSVHCSPVDARLPAGLAWTAAGDALIGSSMVKMAPRLWRYDLKTAALSMVTSGEEVAEYPAVSRQGSLAYVISTRRVSIYQLDLGSSVAGRQQPNPIAFSSTVQSDPDYSPDAGKIAFVSVRSGSPEIWVTHIDTQTSTQLTHFAGLAGSPSWSPDGKYIAFDSAQSTGSQIYVIAADGGAPRQITAAPGENVVPSWSRDGRYLYFSSNRNGDFQIWKCGADTGETQSHPAFQVTQKGGFRAFESAAGAYLYYAKGRGKPGLWRRGLLRNADVEESVLESLQQWGWWAPGRELVYFLELPNSLNAQVRLKMLDMKTARISELAKLPFPVLTLAPALAVSRDGQHFAFSQIDSMEADIMLRQNIN
jgi:Tol biopolymer transport system component/DNA-binding winged helix-turn-helix (wHTH) protein